MELHKFGQRYLKLDVTHKSMLGIVPTARDSIEDWMNKHKTLTKKQRAIGFQ